jgi:hypothetical protein
MPKIAEMKLSSCGFEVADIRKNCDCGIAVAEQHFFKKLRNCDCGSASFKLRNCDCGLQKKLRVPTSANCQYKSHLGRSGTSLYARDWTELVAATSNCWRGVRICPLIPIIVAGCPGPIVREIRELAIWYQTIYDSDPQGMHESWLDVVAAMESCSIGETPLEVMESYKVVQV